MKARDVSHRVVDIPVPGSSTLRVALAEDGEAGEVLILSHGFGGGDRPFTRPDYCGLPIRLPAEVLPELRRALELLEDER